jgi:hypothetical protein
VTVSFSYTFRSYSADPLLEITDVHIDPAPEGSATNFSVEVISRTLREIPGAVAQLRVFDENNTPIVTGRAQTGSIASGERGYLKGAIDTSKLVGGIYRTEAEVTYGSKVATYNKSILRIGTLTIDLIQYTKTFTFNQTNRFEFNLKSNWNKPLTRVSATVNLLGMSKRSVEQTIRPFEAAEAAEVYFDRTETPAGPIEGSMTVVYEELAQSVAKQDEMISHTFTIPIHLNVVMPPEPAKVETEWHLEPIHIMIAASVFLCIVILILAVMLLRKPKVE